MADHDSYNARAAKRARPCHYVTTQALFSQKELNDFCQPSRFSAKKLRDFYYQDLVPAGGLVDNIRAVSQTHTITEESLDEDFLYFTRASDKDTKKSREQQLSRETHQQVQKPVKHSRGVYCKYRKQTKERYSDIKEEWE